MLDTGIWNAPELKKDSSGHDRLLARYDVFTNKVTNGGAPDQNGHGTHVASTILSSRRSSSGKFVSVAPDARLVVVKAFAATAAPPTPTSSEGSPGSSSTARGTASAS